MLCLRFNIMNPFSAILCRLQIANPTWMFGDLCLFWMILKMSRLLYNCAKIVKLCNILLFLQFLLFSYLHEFKFRNDIFLLVWLLLWCWLVCIRPSRKEIFMFEGEALCTDFDKSSPYNFSACVKKMLWPHS